MLIWGSLQEKTQLKDRSKKQKVVIKINKNMVSGYDTLNTWTVNEGGYCLRNFMIRVGFFF